MRNHVLPLQHLVAAVVVALAAIFANSPLAAKDSDLQHSIEQLRSVVGQWSVETEFLKPDGTVSKSVAGTYEFSWVVADKLVSGRSEIPELKQISAILFYINETARTIEMTSVGGDGRLWIMTGPLGHEIRTTKEFQTDSGGKGMLRFTRFNVSADSFESKMEYTEDDGVTWKPGNHQLFRRSSPGAP